MNRAETKDAEPLKILFIDPHSAFVTWAEGLVSEGGNWEVERTDDQRHALVKLQQSDFDAVIVGGVSSFERELGILKQVASTKPRAARILLSPPLGSSKLVKALDVVHRAIFQGAGITEILSSVEHAVLITQQLYRDKMMRSFAAFRRLPSSPVIYRELSNALSGDRNTRDIALILERDPALVAHILRLLNSSYFGLNQNISDITESLAQVSVRTVRGLALLAHLNAHYSGDSGWQQFSFDRIFQRALCVACLAQEIAAPFAKQHKNPALKDQAFLAGLLLDTGMLMLASEQGAGYLKVLRFAAGKKQSLHRVERTAYGVTHAELGAYLINMWNLPPQVVEAVMMHHNPAESVGQTFSPLSAVHIADALLPTVDCELDVDLSASLSEDYIERLDLTAELPRWKMIANGYRVRMRQV